MVLFESRDALRAFLGDHLNTIRDVVDTSGNIVNHLTIDSFGRRTAETNGNIEVMIGLSGRPYDEDTRLQNHVNRWYSVDTGRWLSEDPIGFAGGHANMYAYTANSPTNQTDPFGEFPVLQITVTVFGFRIPLAQIDFTPPVPPPAPPPVTLVVPTKPNIPEGFWDSIGQSVSSIRTSAKAIGADLAGDQERADELYSEAYAKGPLGQTEDAPGYHAATWAALGVSSAAATTALAVGTVSSISTWASPVARVTHWGPPGMTTLRTGDWVVKGGPTWSNYIQSGVWQPGAHFASPNSYITSIVPKSALKVPSGWQSIKVILGQRIYIGG
jgi:RHS repeat-associated protein